VLLGARQHLRTDCATLPPIALFLLETVSRPHASLRVAYLPPSIRIPACRKCIKFNRTGEGDPSPNHGLRGKRKVPTGAAFRHRTPADAVPPEKLELNFEPFTQADLSTTRNIAGHRTRPGRSVPRPASFDGRHGPGNEHCRSWEAHFPFPCHSKWPQNQERPGCRIPSRACGRCRGSQSDEPNILIKC